MFYFEGCILVQNLIVLYPLLIYHLPTLIAPVNLPLYSESLPKIIKDMDLQHKSDGCKVTITFMVDNKTFKFSLSDYRALIFAQY